jgi:glutamate carboxypeptidase
MPNHAPILAWIDSQANRLRSLVVEWANINSNTRNLEGLARLTVVLKQHLSVFKTEIEEITLPAEQLIDSKGNLISLPLAPALRLRKRSDALLRVFLNIHIDTVYSKEDPFQKTVEQLDANKLRGPGVIDAKGGLAVLLIALEAFERSEAATHLGWELFINTDEEVGSPGSASFFAEAAGRNHLALLFEPAMPDGALVSERKGSGNFSIIFRGRAAHAGRDFGSGRNAIVAASDFALEAHRFNGMIPDVTINVARIEGGGPANVVPDLAIVHMNARVARREDQARVEDELNRLAREIATRHEVSATVHGHFASPPKQLDPPTRALAGYIESCGKDLNIPITWRPSGGASDGNKLAAAGLPVIDTLGPQGANLHSPSEFLLVDSLAQRAKLAALVLLKLASRELPWPPAE